MVEKVLVLLVLLVQELAEGLLEPLVYVVAVQAAWVVEMVELGPAALRVWDILAPVRADVV